MTGGMGFWACSAQRQSEAGDVRFGSQADIPIILFDVRFTPESGRSPRDQDVCFGPCVDGSELARTFFTNAALVGAAMCSAC